jgi:alanine-synthesizing transaminase
MRLCANVPTQYTIQTALGGYQSINDLVSENGRLNLQRNMIYDAITKIPGVSCVKPKGAMYLFPGIDLSMYNFSDDNDFALRLLDEKHVLIVPGSGFNHKDNHHFRIVFLPDAEMLSNAAERIKDFFESYSL